MLVPVTTVNKNYLHTASKDQIRLSWQCLVVQTEPQSELMNHSAHSKFWSRISRTHPPHDCAPLLPTELLWH